MTLVRKCSRNVDKPVKTTRWVEETSEVSRRRKTSHQSRDGEVSSVHLLSQPVDFSPGVKEDDSLGDGQRFIQITQGVQLPLL